MYDARYTWVGTGDYFQGQITDKNAQAVDYFTGNSRHLTKWRTNGVVRNRNQNRAKITNFENNNKKESKENRNDVQLHFTNIRIIIRTISTLWSKYLHIVLRCVLFLANHTIH